MAMDVLDGFALIVRSFNSLLPICVESALVLCVIHAVAVGTIRALTYRRALMTFMQCFEKKTKTAFPIVQRLERNEGHISNRACLYEIAVITVAEYIWSQIVCLGIFLLRPYCFASAGDA